MDQVYREPKKSGSLLGQAALQIVTLKRFREAFKTDRSVLLQKKRALTQFKRSLNIVSDMVNGPLDMDLVII
jgi:hypothetical protein